MELYRIFEDETFSNSAISPHVFGINFVTNYDHEFSGSNESIAALETLNPSILRYPGGSVTENIFADTIFSTEAWEANEVLYGGETVTLTTMRETFAVASEVNASVQLVIPTRVAFEQSASEAILSNNFGSRNLIKSEYFDQVAAYVDRALILSMEHNVPISSLEIGNEFWGSGEMSAREYGSLSGQLVSFLSTRYPEINTIIQMVSSAGFFSPSRDLEVLIDPTSQTHEWIRDIEEYQGSVPSHWRNGEIPGQGNALTQNAAIAAAFSAVPGAVAALDGVVNHVYFNGGFQGIDGERDFALQVAHDAFLSALGKNNLDFWITEWSPRNRGSTGNSDGLQYAHTTVEAFFELVSNGVDGANFWPTTFGNPQTRDRTLIDTTDNELTFGGVAFQWLSQLSGMVPIIDYEVSGEIDIHGFSATDRLTLLVSERGEAATQPGEIRTVGLDLGTLALPGTVLVSISRLSSSDGSITNNSADPVVLHEGGFVLDGGAIVFDLGAWELVRIQTQAVTVGDDILFGTVSNDSISGHDGNDRLHGYEGNDRLRGQFGSDTLYGDFGNDTLIGGWGNDHLLGGEGDDRLEGGFENDLLLGNAGNDTLDGEYGDDNLRGGLGNDQLWGGPGRDSLDGGSESDMLYGGDGDDILQIGAGADLATGGHGNDLIELTGVGYFEQGYYALNVSSPIQTGTGVYASLAGKMQLESVMDGGIGEDTLQLSDEADAFFLHDAYSDFHSEIELSTDQTGRQSAARFENIEQIRAMGGDDIIDLTSSDYSLLGISMLIDGGSGNDIIWGSDASEHIFGGNGNDTIFGGVGTDTLMGGEGADTFEFTRSSTDTHITDFDASEGDILRFYNTGSIMFDPWSLTVAGQGLSISYNDTATGETGDIFVSLQVNSSDIYQALLEFARSVEIA